MEERLLFERIHEALDVDPRPAGYERMRTALIRHSSTPRRRTAFFNVRLNNKMVFRLAAAIVLVATAATVGAVFISTHRVAQQNVPAKLDANTTNYQTLVSVDDNALVGSESNHCDTVADTGCQAALARLDTAAQKWSDDLGAYATPAVFRTIDAQVRLHVTALIGDIRDASAAQRAGNEAAMVSAIEAGGQEANWLGATTTAISVARPASDAQYVSAVKGVKPELSSCDYCRQLAGQPAVTCASNPYPSCDLEIVTAKQTVTDLQAAVVIAIPPTALHTKDARLQQDLARADTALIKLRLALRAGDLAGWDAQRVIFGQALADTEKDISAISG